MKRIGLIGGMSFESSIAYERMITEAVRTRLGPNHSAEYVLVAFDFAEIERLQEQDAWEEAGSLLATAAQQVVAAGAELVVLCTNTMHRLADRITAAIDVPFIHIADPTGEALVRDGVGAVALLGTRYTMEGAFYRDHLADRFGLRVLVPDDDDRDLVHRVIYDELIAGVIDPHSRDALIAVIDRLARDGAQAAILGCTELGLLFGPGDTALPLYDTAALHAAAAARFAVEQ